MPHANQAAFPSESQPGKTLEGKYLTFALGKEGFGIAISKVREVIGLLPITPIPRTPAFIKGVINLRGRVIPVVDLRSKFGLPAVPPDERNCIVVTEVGTGRQATAIGLVVDQVNEVANVKKDELEAPPAFGAAVDTTYILALAKLQERVSLLLDIDLVLGERALDRVAGLA